MKAYKIEAHGLVPDKIGKYLVSLTPIEKGTVLPTRNGWVHVVDGEPDTFFQVHEIAWLKEKP